MTNSSIKKFILFALVLFLSACNKQYLERPEVEAPIGFKHNSDITLLWSGYFPNSHFTKVGGLAENTIEVIASEAVVVEGEVIKEIESHKINDAVERLYLERFSKYAKEAGYNEIYISRQPIAIGLEDSDKYYAINERLETTEGIKSFANTDYALIVDLRYGINMHYNSSSLINLKTPMQAISMVTASLVDSKNGSIISQKTVYELKDVEGGWSNPNIYGLAEEALDDALIEIKNRIFTDLDTTL